MYRPCMLKIDRIFYEKIVLLINGAVRTFKEEENGQI